MTVDHQFSKNVQMSSDLSVFPCYKLRIEHAHRGEILYSRGRISSCKTVYIEFLWFAIVSVLME